MSGISPSAALAVMKRHFGVDVEVRPLVGYADANFFVRWNPGHQRLSDGTAGSGSRGVLKVSRANAPEEEIAYLAELHSRIAANAPELPVPRIVRSIDGNQYERSDLVGGRFVRLQTYLPGRPLADVNPKTASMFGQVGVVTARIDEALSGLDCVVDTDWDLASFGHHRGRFEEIRDALSDDLQQIISTSFEWFSSYQAGPMAELRRGVIHGDVNDYNVLFDGFDGLDPQLSGIIDFGDSTSTELVNESAIALAYLMMSRPDPMAAAFSYLKGYTSVLELEEDELEVLPQLISCRLSTSIIGAAVKQAEDPDNEYHQISAAPARELLHQLSRISPSLMVAIFRNAAGYDPCRRGAAVRDALRRSEVHPLLELDFDQCTVEVVDLSVGSNAGDAIDAKSHELEKRRFQSSDDVVQIGRYDEARIAYRADQYAVDSDIGNERRTIHLGIDVFGPSGMPVRTPVQGTVHSIADNDADLDYGPTVVLRHELDGERFYSLFGHLSRESLLGLEVGQTIAGGDVVARLGDRQENGGWAPHLHYQLMIDMFGESNSFPGVASPSRRAVYTSNCPDPNLLLRIPSSAFPAAEKSSEDIETSRRDHLGPSLSLSYRRPLHIVRGEGVWLINSDGQRYLDCVNNVCHVGHCHPRVVEAIARQASLLNTNTRYLHRNIVEYASALCSKLPSSLSVCYFVCSGSEANDLALRMARSHTGRKGIVVLDSGYHGNLTSLVEISAYKFDGPGGSGSPRHVEVSGTPDPYRREADAAFFADEVQAACERLEAKGFPPAAFVAETILSCAGQVEPPEGYLASAYRHARGSGAVCIADEVQTGFGRMGSHFWAFETQGVVPDIVTMGKPIGNGHPVAAVVTTPEIAGSFNNGMEYFNTFGGNPVSSAAAQAVLDVIIDEGLQENAAEVGTYFVQRLSELMVDNVIIGDVRGRGLFLGLELVQSREGKEPAALEASYVVNRMRERGVLLSTDGPHHNVIKIKPPLVFTRSNVDQVVDGLREVFREDYVLGIGRRDL